MEIQLAFGRAVRLKRVERGLSQEGLSNQSGVGRSFLSAIERGAKDPGTQTLWKLCAALDCRPSEIWMVAERLHGEG